MIRKLHDESGQMLITVGLLTMFILAIVAIVAESGLIFTQRRNLQNDVDAAALAGAQELNGTAASEAPAVEKAEEYANLNLDDIKDLEITVFDGFTKITVRAVKPSGTLFSGLYSFGDPDVDADATARVASQNLPGPGVVPIGVQLSDFDVTSDELVELKEDCSGGPGSSNSGLINLLGDTGDQIRDGFKYGSDVPLTPTVNTEPGCKFGQATQNKNSGLRVRVTRSLFHSPRCFTWADVQPVAEDDWPCNPFTATEDDGVQATMVILIPVIVEDFTEFNGNKTIHVAECAETPGVTCPPSGDIFYTLAYFWIDAEQTWEDPAAGDFDLHPGNPKGSIFGRFMQDVPTILNVFDRDECGEDDCDVIDFDPESIFRIIQLIE